MSSTISKDEKKAIIAINRALKASDKKLAQTTIKLAKAQLKDTSNARKAISKALNAKDKKLAKEVAASAKKYLKELAKKKSMNLPDDIVLHVSTFLTYGDVIGVGRSAGLKRNGGLISVNKNFKNSVKIIKRRPPLDVNGFYIRNRYALMLMACCPHL